MKNKRVFALVLAMVLAASVLLSACGQLAQEGVKTFKLEVCHSDGSTKTFEFVTDKLYLSEALLEEGVIESGGADDGMYNIVDGEEASWAADQAYWGFYVNDAYATQGMDTTAIEDGATYKLVYEKG